LSLTCVQTNKNEECEYGFMIPKDVCCLLVDDT
jgi:hypothetical protein